MTTRRRFLGAVASGLAASVAGCGYRPGAGDVRWRADGLSGLYSADVVDVTGGHLYRIMDSGRTYDFDTEQWGTFGSVTAYRTSDGSERWSEEFPGEIAARDIDAGSAAVAVDDAGTVVRLGPEGEQWRTPVGDGEGSDGSGAGGQVIDLAVAGDRVYALTAAGTLVACADGEPDWRLELSPGSSGDDRRGGTVGADDGGVVCHLGGTAVGLAPDGTREWSRDHSAPRGTELAAVARGSAFLTDAEGVRVLDVATGDERWSSTEIDAFGSPTVTDDAVYYAGHDSVVAFDRSGERRWGYPVNDGRVAADDSGVFVPNRPGLVALSPDDASVRWEAQYDRVSSGPFLGDSGVLVESDGDLLCHYR